MILKVYTCIFMHMYMYYLAWNTHISKKCVTELHFVEIHV